jgi:aminoglycoside phosphotransferase family enzyme/predicted kinase
VIETHISRVLLVGDLVYKFKKPVNLGFLDFSTRARRRHFLDEELRLNRRLAAGLYLDVVPITGPPERPAVGGQGAVLDYALRMRRFPQDALLTRRPLSDDIVDALADRLARFHAEVPMAAADSAWGEPAQVLAPMLENFAMIREALPLDAMLARRLERLEDWTLRSGSALRRALEARRRDGFIRECHGDLHRGNIAVVDREPLIFDCIEFSPALRWIDTASEIAFLLMDFRRSGGFAQAYRLLNRYLMLTGDYGLLRVLRLYLVYRAMVRAKVTAIGAAQHHHGEALPVDPLGGYVREALAWSRPTRPRLLLLCGLSGSGKTFLACRLAVGMGLIHIRSDVERKRLFGLASDARTLAGLGSGIYSADATDRTYRRLLVLAEQCLKTGHSVLLDATFLSAAWRRLFRVMAASGGWPLDILALDAPRPVLRRRVLKRQADGADPSEADLAVLEYQLVHRDALTTAEREHTIFIDTRGPLAGEALVRQLCA